MPYDIAIIFGGGRNTNDILNLRTKERLEKAIELFQANMFAKMILAGGISFSAPVNFIRSEASLMKDYMLAKGIPEHKIYLEEKSTDTLSNAFFQKKSFYHLITGNLF